MNPFMEIAIAVLLVIVAILFTPFWFGLLEWFWDKQADFIRAMRRPKEPK